MSDPPLEWSARIELHPYAGYRVTLFQGRRAVTEEQTETLWGARRLARRWVRNMQRRDARERATWNEVVK